MATATCPDPHLITQPTHFPIPENLTYVVTPGYNTYDTPMAACCDPNSLQLAEGCYKWCELPATYADEDTALSRFMACRRRWANKEKMSTNGTLKYNETSGYHFYLHVAESGPAGSGVTTVRVGMFVLVASMFMGLV
ncbi:hypothetical protein CSPX01_03814 [Colletotrichum filicis]|nr:hypothetical protein CSPX01_03814 [Colletotrichum filicis]